jgi:hypothetical protein
MKAASPPPPKHAGQVFTLVALVLATAFGLAWTRLPAPLPEDAPKDAFSAMRARAHLEVVARRPHPIGSVEHAAVRAYLVEQLRALGLEPEVQEATVARTRYREPRLAVVKNVVARRAGTARDTAKGAGKALLLMAHYDSRAMTPGASDDGYGVVAMLEVARALAGEALASDVLFLFTDGEEEGLLGAQAFATQHRWAGEVGVILNVEARGNAGPVMMFQTGDDNGALVRELATAAPRVVGSSLSQAIYRRMPNDTDLSIFLPATPSLNFANVDGLEQYHSPTDTVANADLGTLQEGGANLLGVARALASRPLPLPAEPDATYFNVGTLFARYPCAWDLPLAGAAAALLGVFVGVARRKGELRLPFAALGALASLLVVAAAALAGLCAWTLASRLHGDYALVNAARPLLKGLWFATFVALGAGLALAAQASLRGRLRVAELFAGSMTNVVVIALALASRMPGASFVFTWPVLAALPFAIALVATGSFDRDDARGVAAAAAMAAVPLVIIAPFVPQIFITFGPPIGLVIAAMAANLAMVCAPAVRHLLEPSPRLAPRVALLGAAASLVAANAVGPFDGAHPRPESVLYAVDGDSDRSFWLTPDAAPPAWASLAFVDQTRGAAPLPFPPQHVLAVPAPATVEPRPVIAWIDRDQVRVTPPAGAGLLAVRVEGASHLRVDGIPLPAVLGAVSFRFFAPPAEGVLIDLGARAAGPVVIRVASQRAGLPAGLSAGTRPEGSMPKPGGWDTLLESDTTLVAVSSTR